jgi:protein TonB
MPSYPEEAQRRGIEGTVVLRLHVTRDGVVDVATIEISAGSSLLDDAALDFARSIRLTPAQLDDQPVETVVRLPVTFRLVAP